MNLCFPLIFLSPSLSLFDLDISPAWLYGQRESAPRRWLRRDGARYRRLPGRSDARQAKLSSPLTLTCFAQIVLNTIRTLTLAQAKSLIKDINNGHLARIPISGNKPEIISRIISRFEEVKEANNVQVFANLRELLTRYKGPPSSIHTNGYVVDVRIVAARFLTVVLSQHPQHRWSAGY